MQDKRTDPNYQAQAILSRRDHSVFEIQAKMKRKGFTTDQIHGAIAILKKLHLLDDRVFAHKYIEETIHFKAVGPHWLVRGLKQKGIGESIIKEALNEILTPAREQELIRKATAKWQRLHPQYSTDRQRLTRFLISRGFSYAAIEPTSTPGV